MKTFFKLNSVIPGGVGTTSDCTALELIYSFLFEEFQQDHYSSIVINQIGPDLDEFVISGPGKKVHCNIRYPAVPDFENKTVDEKNRIRLDLIHTALLKIAKYDGKLDKNQLKLVKKKILKHNFIFDFLYRTHPNKKMPGLIGKIVIRPLIDRILFHAVIEEEGEVKCNKLIFTGVPTTLYFRNYFWFGKWNKHEYIIYGKERIVETIIQMDRCLIEIRNLTSYPAPPFYTIMRADISEEEKEQAQKDWEHSLPPDMAALLRQQFGNASN